MTEPASSDLRAIRTGYASFVLIGWGGLLVPSLIRSIEHDFGQSDAGLGLFYFVWALFYAIGGGAGGFLTERLGRHVTFPLAAICSAVGLTGLALAPSWVVFLAAAIPGGFGGGAIDGGVNGLLLELRPGQGGAINLLHVFFSVGAFVAPLVVGLLVGAGMAWPAILLATAAASLVIARFFVTARMPSGRRVRRVSPGPIGAEAGGLHLAPRLLTLPILLLGLAILFYVASEIGPSSWMVRFLASAPLEVATAGLSLFWAGLALGRLVSSRVADRFPPIPFTAAAAFASGVAVAAAVVVPSVPVSIALFALAGFAEGPVYPMIMSIAGVLNPGRSGAVSGILTFAAVVGGLIYPPVIGLISVEVGIGAGILGAGLLGLLAGVALLGAGVASGRMEAASPGRLGAD